MYTQVGDYRVRNIAVNTSDEEAVCRESVLDSPYVVLPESHASQRERESLGEFW